MIEKKKKKKNILENKIVFYIASRLGLLLVKALCGSIRYHEFNKKNAYANFDTGMFFFIWHRTLLVPIYANKYKNISTLAALSPDGTLQTYFCEKLGYKVYRGSTRRHGVQGLFNLVKGMKRGENIALTVDGPIGPAEKCQPGAANLIQNSDFPFTAIGVALDRKWTFEKSWDGFQVPKPFCNAYLYYSDPIYLDKNMDKEEILLRIEQEIKTSSRLAEEKMPPIKQRF